MKALLCYADERTEWTEETQGAEMFIKLERDKARSEEFRAETMRMVLRALTESIVGDE